MFAVDDGLWSGNLNAADVLFLIAAILFVIGAILSFTAKPDPARGATLYVGLALVAFGLLVL